MKTILSAEEVFRQLADGLALNSSPQFFPDIVARIAQLLNVDHAFLAEVVVEEGVANTLAVWSQGALCDNFSYALAGTPCDTVLEAGPCFYPNNVCLEFPQDSLLKDMAAEGYFGLPIVAEDGVPLGLLAVLTTSTLALSPVGPEVLRIAAAQAGSELRRRRAEASLLESERRLNTLMDHLPGMAYRCRNDRAWTMEFVSQGAQALTGYSPAELALNKGVEFAQLIHSADRERVAVEVRDSLVAGEHFRCIYRLIKRGGEVRWMWEQGQAVDECGQSGELLEGFITDITDQHESERVQKAVAQTATAITSRLGDDFFKQLVMHLTRALDADSGFVSIIRGEDTMQTQARVVAGQPAQDFEYRLSTSHCKNVMSQGECIGQFDPPIAIEPVNGGPSIMARSYVGRRLDNAEGAPIGTLMVIYSNPSPDTNLATSVLRILATGAAGELERQKNDRRIYQLAYVDATTGLPNRIQFIEQLDTSLRDATRRSGRVGLLFLDVKDFKEINDVLGHSVGDQLLAALGQHLSDSRRPGEVLARLSGDEFALLVPDLEEGELASVIEHFRGALQQSIVAAERHFNLEMSVGAAQFPRDADSPEELLQCASVALHQAKLTDGNACIFDVSMAQQLNRRRAIAERFGQALRNGKLQLHYQPQFDLQSGALAGAEALCRWYDTHWGWVSPAEFVPLAEERGLIRPLGDWVLEAASQQLRRWQDQGLALPGRLSINISALQFGDSGLANHINRMTGGIDPALIGLELTESGFMRDPDLAVEITEQLREAGYGLSVDDFGTGYSSLNYLRRFAADTLKIDMSFVSDMLENHSDYTIVTTIIAMAHSLGMTTVAEGVESRAQADSLRSLGCHRVQGFLYGRPVDGDSFAERWLMQTTDGATRIQDSKEDGCGG